VSNAIKFTFHGFVKLSITTRESDKLICIAIADSGIGIDTKKLDNLMDLFGS